MNGKCSHQLLGDEIASIIPTTYKYYNIHVEMYMYVLKITQIQIYMYLTIVFPTLCDVTYFETVEAS